MEGKGGGGEVKVMKLKSILTNTFFFLFLKKKSPQVALGNCLPYRHKNHKYDYEKGDNDAGKDYSWKKPRDSTLVEKSGSPHFDWLVLNTGKVHCFAWLVQLLIV